MKAVVVLTRGYQNVTQYSELIARNMAIKQHLVANDVEIVIFHEGNIPLEHQAYICKRSIPATFINVKGDYAFKPPPSDLKIYKPSSSFGINYRHMCSFWFVDFWNFVQKYDRIIRIDEDCLIQTSIDEMFHSLLTKHVIFGKWVKDAAHVTHGLQLFTFRHLCNNAFISYVPKSPCGPYTNVIGMNVAELRLNNALMKYVEAVKESNGIYIFRWGDLPLWGDALIYLIPNEKWGLDKRMRYYHGSHNKWV